MYRYFFSAIFLLFVAVTRYMLVLILFLSINVIGSSNRSRDCHQIKLSIENFNRLFLLLLVTAVEVHSSRINSIQISASSSNMLRYISCGEFPLPFTSQSQERRASRSDSVHCRVSRSPCR